LLLWAFVAGSIVVTFTAAPSGGLVDTLFRAPGQFYLETVLTLRQFALLTTLPVRWTDIGYAALSVVPLGTHFFITSVGIDVAAEQYWKDSDVGIHFLLVGVVIAVLVIFGAVLLELLSLTHIFRRDTTLSNGRFSYATADLEITRAINELRGRIKLR
jgi:hypothetical protein